MFELPLFELAIKARTGPAQWFAEFVATFGLIVTILALARFKGEAIPVAVGLYITAAYNPGDDASPAGRRILDTRAKTDRRIRRRSPPRFRCSSCPLLIPGEAAHQNEMMSPVVTE